METLSKTERKVMELRINAGKSRKEIACETFRSELTIKTHFQNIMRKLDARDEIELTVKYLRKYRAVLKLFLLLLIAGHIQKDGFKEPATPKLSANQILNI